jgi:hypothetical protein
LRLKNAPSHLSKQGGVFRRSGLPVQHYSAETLATRLGSGFRLKSHQSERHLTPWGAGQAFVYAVFERRDA